MEHELRNASVTAHRRKYLSDRLHGLAVPREHIRHSLALRVQRYRQPPQYLTQLLAYRDAARLPRLGVGLLQANEPGFEAHTVPGELKDFAPPHAGVVRTDEHRLQVGGRRLLPYAETLQGSTHGRGYSVRPET